MEFPKIRRILCPTDFSPHSRRALDYAVALARIYSAKIEALHVFPLLMPMLGDLTYAQVIVHLDEKTRRALSEDLDQFVQPAKQAGVSTTALLVEGEPSSAIVKRAESVPVDLIVMGTHGLRGFDRWFMGSVAQRVLRKAVCPVLTVPLRSDESRGDEPPALKRILCPLDLSEHSAATLESALSVTRALNASLAVLHVIEVDSVRDEPTEAPSNLPFILEFRRHVEARSRGILESLVPGEIGGVYGIERILVRGRAYEEVLRIAAERGSDMIVIGVHGRKGIGLPWFGSTTQHVVQQAQCPVLTVRPR